MKRKIAMILVLTVILLQGFNLNAQRKKEPVFTIILEQQGSAFGESLQKYVTARYWPCTVWNSGYYGGLNFNEMEASGALVRDTPEGLLTLRGSLAGLKAGEVMLFYVSEKTGKGEAEGCLNELSTIGDGVFRTIIKQGDDVTTHITDPEHERYTKSLGPGSTMNALLKRIPEGALLTFSEPFLEGEGYCDYFGLFDGDNVPENIGQVFSFNLSNEDLKSWGTLKKVNERTLNGPEGGQLHIKATLYGGAGPGYARVSIDGCTQFGEGYQGKVTASGSPDGGSYEFRAEPSDLMTVEVQGPTALLTGSRRGRGTLYVRYTSPDGGVAESSEPVSVVALYSYNNDIPVPKIALYDAEGKKTSASVTVPYSAEPDNANELLDFLTGDPSLLNVMPSAGSLDLQGLKPGKTTIEAQDNCGNIIGPTMEVEVVNCTDETRAKLAEELRIAQDAQKEAYKEIEKILGSEDFTKAADGIAESTGNLAIKVGGAIIGSLSGGKADAGVKTAAKIYGVGSNLYDFVSGLAAGENLSTISNLAQMIVELGGSDNQQALASAMETIQAADEFGKNLGQLISTDRQLQEAMKWAEHWNKYIEDVVRRQQICRESKEEPKAKKQPPKEAVPDKTDPTEPTPSPGEPLPKTQEPAGNEPTGDDQAGAKPVKTEVPPVPPESESIRVGLPFMPTEDCGCNGSREIIGNAPGLTDMESGFVNLGKCVEDFSKEHLTEYVNTLKGWHDITAILDNALKAGPEQLKTVSGQTAPRIKLLLTNTKSFDEAGRAFLEDFEKCPESVKAGIGVLKSAQAVTVGSIKTNY